MKSKLNQLLHYLNTEQKGKDLIELEYNDELKQIISSDTVTQTLIKEAKGNYFSIFGEINGFEEKFDLVRLNRQGQLVIKPKLIQEYMDNNKNSE